MCRLMCCGETLFLCALVLALLFILGFPLYTCQFALRTTKDSQVIYCHLQVPFAAMPTCLSVLYSATIFILLTGFLHPRLQLVLFIVSPLPPPLLPLPSPPLCLSPSLLNLPLDILLGKILLSYSSFIF